MKTILWLAPYVPYKGVNHAGGKNLNYYIKYFNNTKMFDITFIGLGYEWEREKVILNKEGIKTNIYYRDCNRIDYVLRRIISSFTLMNYKSKYYHMLLLYERLQLQSRVKDYYEKGNNPDIIILHWTAMGLMLPWVKKIFPGAKYVIVEEDVSYLGFERKYKANPQNKKLKYQYYNLKKDELNVINQAFLTVTLNQKDRRLLIRDGISDEKVYSCGLYIDNYSDVVREPDGRTLLFYGSMERPENYNSAIWFIDNVMSNLPENIIFDIVGSKPHKSLLDRAKAYNDTHENRVIVEGFVDDIRPFMSKAICMVAPLLLGAGIKAKVLEGMSAGLPVLTNDIGIEGIDATDKKEYIHCEKPKDYIKEIISILNDRKKSESIGSNAQEYVMNEINIEKNINLLVEMLDENEKK